MQELIRFEPVCDSLLKQWSKLERFDFLNRLPTTPIADTELLHISHYCPVVIMLANDGPRVLILLDPAMLLSSPVDKDGGWRPPYMPIALRSLPFWPGTRPAEIQFAPELVNNNTTENYALREASGTPSQQFSHVLAWIERLQQGMRHLSDAAKQLVAADLLTPLFIHQPGKPSPEETEYLTVSPEKFFAFTPARAASLSIQRCLPLDLVTACLFSRRLLTQQVTSKRFEMAESRLVYENWNVNEFAVPI